MTETQTEEKTASLLAIPRSHPPDDLTSGLARVVCEQGDLDAVVELEFLEHTRDMCLHGRDAHVELAADLRVRLAQPDGDRNLALALCQSVELLTRAALPLVGLALGHMADQSASDRRREHRLAGRHGSDRTDDVGRRRVLQQE